MKNFKDIYKKPFIHSLDAVFTEDNVWVFDFDESIDTIGQKTIISILNDLDKPNKGLIEEAKTLYYNQSYIYNEDNKEVISIRGYGHLTGTLKLSSKEADKIQDELGKWILDTLRGINTDKNHEQNYNFY